LGQHEEEIGSGSVWATDSSAHEYEGELNLEVNDCSGAFRSAILSCAEAIFIRQIDNQANITWQEP